MITKFKIFEMFSLERNDCDTADINITLENNSIYINIEDLLFEEDVDKIEDFNIDVYKYELKRTIINTFKKLLNIDRLTNIDIKKFNLLCLIFDTNIIINKYGTSEIEDDDKRLSFYFAGILIGDFIDMLCYELKDFNDTFNNIDKIHDLIIYFIKNFNDITDMFYFKNLWNMCSNEFKENNKYLLDAKKFDLM